MAVKIHALLSYIPKHYYWANLCCLIKNRGELVMEAYLCVLYFPKQVGLINHLTVMLSIKKKKKKIKNPSLI